MQPKYEYIRICEACRYFHFSIVLRLFLFKNAETVSVECSAPKAAVRNVIREFLIKNIGKKFFI